MDKVTFEVAEANFFHFDAEVAAEIISPLLLEDFSGFILKSLPQLDILQHGKMPAILVAGVNALRAWEIEYEANVKVVAVHLDSGDIWIAPAFVEEKDVESEPKQDKPTGQQAQNIFGYCDCLDLKYLGLPCQPGKYAISCIYLDKLSNTAFSEVTGRPFSPKSLIASNNLLQGGQNCPRLSEQGAAFWLPQQIVISESCHFCGSFCLQINAGHISTENNSAVVPVALLLIAKDCETIEFYWNVPLSGTFNVGDIATGYFSADLSQQEIDINENVYHAYFVVDRYVSGPQKVIVK